MQSTTLLAGAKSPSIRRYISGQALWVTLSVVCLAFFTSYFRNVVHFSVPVLSANDQMAFVSDGARIIHGQLIYRDFFQFVTPGTSLFYAFLLRCFGVSLWIPDLSMVFLATVTSLLLAMSAASILRGYFAALPCLLFAGFVLWGSLDATHHWYSTVLVMGAMLALLKGSELRHVTAAGALCGLAASFTQSAGAAALAGFVVYLLCRSSQDRPRAGKSWRPVLLLCVMAVIVFLAVNGYFILAVGVKRWTYCMITFPIRYYSTMPINSWQAPRLDFVSHLTGLVKWIGAPFNYLVVPFSPVVVLWKIARRSGTDTDEPSNQLLLISITAIALFLSVASSLTLKRISSISPPALILLAWLCSNHSKASAATAWVLGAVSVAIALFLPLRVQTAHWNVVDLPTGRVAIANPVHAELYSWLAKHTEPGEAYFGSMSIAFPLGLYNPAPIDYVVPWAYTRPEQIDTTIAAIDKYEVRIITVPAFDMRGTYNQTSNPFQVFQNYLRHHYRLVNTFPSGDTAWERVDAMPLAIPK